MRISYKERHRRAREAMIDAWRDAYDSESDPGLRDVYHELPRAPIRLLCCPLVKDVNQGGILRLAEAFRIERVEYTQEADFVTDFSGHRGTLTWQPYQWRDVDLAVAAAKADGYHTVALTLSDRAVPIERYEWQFPLALVVGEEKFGIPEVVEQACDGSVAIPLFGMVRSLNVTTAAAIALHQAMLAYLAHDPEFRPARRASQRLLDKDR